jgi:hypothetical protein
MKIRRPVPAKIVLGSSGLGVPDPDLLRRRAEEVAAIEGRAEPNSNDWEAARSEVHGRGASDEENAGEVWSSEAEMIGIELGHSPGDLEMEDEGLGEELVRDGVEEADHERMLLGHALNDADTIEPVEE